MEKFRTIDAVAVPLPQANVDTDQITPARFLSRPRDDNHGNYLFRDLRLRPDGTEVESFPMNRPEWRGAQVVVAGRNFACGSSRENAVWALWDAGIRACIAPSFGDIFRSNSLKNGLLPVVLPAEAVADIIDQVTQHPGAHVRVDLAAQTVTAPDGTVHAFDIDPFAKRCMLEGLDELGFTLEHEEEIAAFERRFERDNFFVARPADGAA